MAAITSAVVVAAGSAYAANKQAGAAKDAARAQTNAANAGIAEQQRQFDTFQQNISPYLDTGQMGLNRLQGLLNDPSSIQDSAAYQWRLGQGMQGLDRSAAARGGLFGGGHQTDLMNYGQGMASQEYDSQWNRLAGLASMGQNAAVGAGHMGQANANAIGNLYGQIGQAQAGSAINQANAWSNFGNSLAGLAGNYMGQRQTSYQAPATNQWSGTGNSLINNPASNWNFGGRG